MFSLGQYVSDTHEYVRTFVRPAVGALLVPASEEAAPWPTSDDAADDAAEREDERDRDDDTDDAVDEDCEIG